MKVNIKQLLTFVILVAAVAAAAFYGVKEIKGKDGNDTRQAVFLTNGQVYFGYVTGENSKTVTIRDIYYLQVQQPLQQGNQQQKTDEQPQVSLVKLGNELHGPEDEMRINREHVLFIEDMKTDAKVNQAIAEYIKTGGQQQVQQNQQQ